MTRDEVIRARSSFERLMATTYPRQVLELQLWAACWVPLLLNAAEASAKPDRMLFNTPEGRAAFRQSEADHDT